jgi:hypothetical protein
MRPLALHDFQCHCHARLGSKDFVKKLQPDCKARAKYVSQPTQMLQTNCWSKSKTGLTRVSLVKGKT